MAEIRMEYDAVEALIEALRMAEQELEETRAALRRVADDIENGALLGRVGEEFADALRGTLSMNIERLEERLAEMRSNIQVEIDDMREAENRSRGLFS